MSGQLVNNSKSFFLMPTKASLQRRSCVARSFGFEEGQLPLRYLGAPLFVGQRKSGYFHDLLNKVIRNSWGRNMRRYLLVVTLFSSKVFFCCYLYIYFMFFDHQGPFCISLRCYVLGSFGVRKWVRKRRIGSHRKLFVIPRGKEVLVFVG